MAPAPLLPGEEQPRGRPDLPDLERGLATRYRRGWQLEERLQGLLLILMGVCGLALAAYFPQFDAALRPSPPPGIPSSVILSPMTCLIPLLGIGGLGVIFVGLRRLFNP